MCRASLRHKSVASMHLKDRRGLGACADHVRLNSSVMYDACLFLNLGNVAPVIQPTT